MKRIYTLTACLSLAGCTAGFQAVGVHGSIGRAANRQEAVAESGAYLASNAVVEFRGVEMLAQLDNGFWDLAGGFVKRLLPIGMETPVDRAAWL